MNEESISIKEKTFEWMRGYATHRKDITSVEQWLDYGDIVRPSKYYRQLRRKY
jgi:hypothetical protein